LKSLTNIEEMLIAQVFPIISVFILHGGQYAYSGNIINFLQDLQEFVTQLPCNPSTLDFLIVWQHSTNRSNFCDFNVYREKIIQNGSIVEQLPQLIDENNKNDEQNEQSMNQDSELIENEFVSQTFVPSLLPGQNEDTRLFTS
ncbi:40598_t:CDS:2, partial [Gigaspora margarita]